MPRGFVFLIVGCLALAAPGVASAARVEALLDFPLPARDVGNSELGVGAGVSVTSMPDKYVGVGVDLVYHYWPASAGFTGAFDRYLRTRRYQALEGDTWAFTTVGFTPHLVLQAPLGPRFTQRLQVGAGVYRLNRNLDYQWSPGTTGWIIGPGTGNISAVPGAYGTVGLDFHDASVLSVGVEATFHYLWMHDKTMYGYKDLPDFSALTAGLRVGFGR